MRQFHKLAPIAIAATMLSAGAARAAVIDYGHFNGNDCSDGAFATCAADGTGAGPNHNGSPVIYKLGSNGSQDFGNLATITGSEFTLGFDTATQVLSWTYTPGAGDPPVNYFTIKQGNGYQL